MKTTHIMAAGRYAIYDAPPKLKAFLTARESGTASEELMMQLSEAAMAEQQEELAKRPKATLIDFEIARLEREQQSEKLCR